MAIYSNATIQDEISVQFMSFTVQLKHPQVYDNMHMKSKTIASAMHKAKIAYNYYRYLAAILVIKPYQ